MIVIGYLDIPPVEAVYIEHRAHTKICPCCHCENQGVFPERVKAPVQYGNNDVWRLFI